MHTQPLLNCLIVDDEPLAITALENLLAQIPTVQITAVCSNAMEAFEALHKHTIDILFLDINMPIINGLAFLKSLKEPPAVVFTTAYTEYATDAFELEAVDYLVKPIALDRLEKAIVKVLKLKNIGNANLPSYTVSNTIANPANPEKDYFFVKANGKLVKLNFADIKYIEGMKDYLKIVTKDAAIVCHHTMKLMEEQLPTPLFLRVHKSYIVALGCVKAIDGNQLQLDMDRVEIPIGSSYKEEVMRTIVNQ